MDEALWKHSWCHKIWVKWSNDMWHSLLPIFKRERGLVCQAGVWFGVSFAIEMGLVLLWVTQHHRPQSWAWGHWEWEEVASERPPGSCFLCMPRAVGVTVSYDNETWTRKGGSLPLGLVRFEERTSQMKICLWVCSGVIICCPALEWTTA